MNLRTLARMIVKRRIQAGAPPAGNLHYETDPIATRTDRGFKRWVALAGLLHLDLDVIAALAGTDKFGMHEYTPVYGALMRRFRGRSISLLELGVGGYTLASGGESLSMWAAYFRRGHIYGLDISDKTGMSRGRVKVFQGSQTDHARLTTIGNECGPFDFIIDDGSHNNTDQIQSFRILWPFVKDGGMYIVEDVQTSYWPTFGGGAIGSEAYQTSCIAFFKSLVDSVNRCEFLERSCGDAVIEPTIGGIEFRHNLIVITKDSTTRRSNLDLDDAKIRSWLLSPSSYADPQSTSR